MSHQRLNTVFFVLLSLMFFSNLGDWICAGDPVRSEGVVIAGNGKAGPVDSNPLISPTDTACISNPFGVEPMVDGSILVSSFDRHSIYRVDVVRKSITRLAGLGVSELFKPKGQSAGPAIAIEMDQPHEVRVDSSGDIFVADTRNHRIGRIDSKTMQWATIAGTGVPGFSGDGGAADLAQLNSPHSLVLDDAIILIADLGNHRIRAIDRKSNRIMSIAGTGEAAMPTSRALGQSQPLLGPRSLAMDSENIWIALREGNSIWRFDRKNGKMEHLAGTGRTGSKGDGGQAIEAELNGPKGIAVEPDKALYIADTENHAIRRVDLLSGVITTIAGDLGKRGGLSRPHGIAWVPNQGLIVGDSENHRVILYPNSSESR